MKSLLPILALAVVPALSDAAPTIWGVNDHAYEMITEPNGLPTYGEAKAAAEAMTFRGVQGRLLVLETATYASEFSFVRNSIILPNSPLTGYWVGASRADATGNLRENWLWEDGTTVPTSITNGWNIDIFEGGGATPYGGFFYSADNFGTIWDYAKSDPSNMTGGYIVEFAAPVPEPATMAVLGLGAAALLRRRRKA